MTIVGSNYNGKSSSILPDSFHKKAMTYIPDGFFDPISVVQKTLPAWRAAGNLAAGGAAAAAGLYAAGGGKRGNSSEPIGNYNLNTGRPLPSPSQRKRSSGKQAARAAARVADVELRRHRIPGDPQLGQRAEYSLTNATNFKRPCSINLGKSTNAPVLKDWLSSLVQSSKFNVQFACDWKSKVNSRTISWHCFRHNMSSSRRYFGMDGNNTNALDNTTPVSDAQSALSGYVANAAWPQWMDPKDPTVSYGWVGEGATTNTNGIYSGLGYKNFMLRPDNTTTVKGSNIQNAMDNTVTDINGGYIANQQITHPFIEQLHNRIYYAPINISDLEDESYYNNRIVVPGQFDPIDNTPDIADRLLTNAHRSVSEVGQQNVKYRVDPTTAPYVQIEAPTVGTSIPTSGSSRNQYKGLIKKGNVNYKFINKSDGPGKIEVIVWKFKSTHVSPPCFNILESGHATTDSRYYMQFADSTVVPPGSNTAAAGTPVAVCNAIQTTLDRYSEAYFKAVTSKYGSDDMSGRPPVVDDIYNNPNFPLFKKYSKYFQESLCDFSEHSRYTYNLQSGQRQEVNIQLPGEHYNPCAVGKAFGLNASQNHGIEVDSSSDFMKPGFGTVYGENPVNPFNKFTYFVMIATSGCNMAATFEKGVDGNYYADPASSTPPTAPLPKPVGPSSIDVGTAWSSSHIQAYCTYSEDIGAMSCKVGKRNLYNLGGLSAPVAATTTTSTDNATPAPVYNLNIGPKIPMDRIVRIPPQITVNRITLGNTTTGAMPTDGTTSSANRAASDVHNDIR